MTRNESVLWAASGGFALGFACCFLFAWYWLIQPMGELLGFPVSGEGEET